MLNPFLRDRIKYAEFRLLYDNRLRISHPTMKAEIQKHIRQIRNEVSRRALVDRLEQKLGQFGNMGGWSKHKINELSRIIYEAKGVPNASIGLWRSIEFELILKSERALHDFVSFVRAKKYTKLVTIKDDGSIKPDQRGEFGKEIVVSYKTGDEHIVREICENLRDKAYVNKTCGTHVHFDMRNVLFEDVQVFGARLAKCVPALKQLLPVSRRENQYCKGSMSSEDRYTFVNLAAYNKHKTLEIRGHSGTIIANKILNWIKLCDVIMATKLPGKTKEIVSITELVKTYQLDEVLTDYVNSRFKRFGGTLNDIEDIADDNVSVAKVDVAAIVPAPQINSAVDVAVQHVNIIAQAP